MSENMCELYVRMCVHTPLYMRVHMRVLVCGWMCTHLCVCVGIPV